MSSRPLLWTYVIIGILCAGVLAVWGVAVIQIAYQALLVREKWETGDTQSIVVWSLGMIGAHVLCGVVLLIVWLRVKRTPQKQE